MPANPNIVLGAGQILAIQSDSALGIEIQTFGFLYGLIVMVYDGSDKSTVGQLFIFKQSDALVLKFGSTVYYQLYENSILSSEVVPP